MQTSSTNRTKRCHKDMSDSNKENFNTHQDSKWSTDLSKRPKLGNEKNFKPQSRNDQTFHYRILPVPPRFLIKDVRVLDPGKKILFELNVEEHERKYKLSIEGRYCEEDVFRVGQFISVQPCDNLLKEGYDCIGNSNDTLLILYPDYLISATTVASSINCKRKTVLNELFKKTQYSKPMLLGNILHQMFATAFKEQNFTRTFFMETYKAVCSNLSHLESFYALNLSPSDLQKDVESYISPMAKLGATLRGKIPNKVLNEFAIQNLVCDEIESTVWAPIFGLKGKIDVLATNVESDDNFVLELKTGKESNSIEHQDQVRLYLNMLPHVKQTFGFLIYLKTGAIYCVDQKNISIKELTIIRNRLVFHLSQLCSENVSENQVGSELPDLEESTFNCRLCEQRFTCGLTSRLIQNKQPKLVDLHTDTENYPISHSTFFVKWYKLCILEYPISATPSDSQIWRQSYQQRVDSGLVDGELLIDHQRKENTEKCGEGYLIKFKSANNAPIRNIMVEDRVIVSPQCLSKINVCSGTVVKAENTYVEIISEQTIDEKKATSKLWRLDKTEVASGSTLGLMLSNLSTFMSQSIPRIIKVRKLIVDAETPKFANTDKNLIPTEMRDQAKEILRGLNACQKLAVRKVLMCSDYTIIRGMPGSGKTTVIVAVIRLLLLCGHRVLLTSFTNAAVDNVLLRLQKINPSLKMVRLGVKSRVHPSLHCYLSGANGVEYSKVAYQFDSADVVAGTVFNVNHPLFCGMKRAFNFCVVDEASQILLPLAIGPILAAQRFVLVGDEHQLPPLVSNQKAKTGGLSESLFQMIASRNSEAVFSLHEQYRMNNDIMQLSNTLSYDGQMRAGSAVVADRKMNLKPYVNCNKKCCMWLNFCLNPDKSAIFVDTNGLQGELSRTNSYLNCAEIEVICTILKTLKRCGVPMTSVGIICPYRQQLMEAQSKLCGPNFEGLEVHTVDKFQGRDKEVILMTCVKSSRKSENVKKEELLNDKQRVNVAMSRAKSKLIVIGDLITMKFYQPMGIIIDVMQSKSCVIPFTEHSSDSGAK